MQVYLDNAATTRLDDQVLESMIPYFKDHYGNPSSIHSHGRKTRAAIERSRKSVASLLNCSPAEIFFTSGGTEANNCIIGSLVSGKAINRIVTSKLEHHCILHTIEHLEKMYGIEVQYVNNNNSGDLDLEHLEELIGDGKRQTLVSLMHANNEIGNLLNMDRVSEMCEKYGCYFHSDTVQTIAHIPFDLQQLKIHSIIGSGHKFHGPKGVGFMYVNKDLPAHPLIRGGGQERNMRAGTENLYGIVGLAAAMKVAYDNLNTERQYITSLRSYCYEKILAIFPEVTVNGRLENSLYTILNLNFSAYPKSALLLLNLDIAGICASGGSACSSGANNGSHVIKALSEKTDKMNSIRFSFSKYNTQKEIDYLTETLSKLLVEVSVESN